MNKASKDVRVTIAMNLSPPDLINFCLSSKRENKDICDSRIFWRNKLEKDYPGELLEEYETNIPIENPKQKYIQKFTFVSREIENFIPEFMSVVFGERMVPYLTETYRKDFYRGLFNIYTEILTLEPQGDRQARMEFLDDIESLLIDLIDKYARQFFPNIFVNDGERNPYFLIIDFIDSLRLKKTSDRTRENIVKQLKK